MLNHSKVDVERSCGSCEWEKKHVDVLRKLRKLRYGRLGVYCARRDVRGLILCSTTSVKLKAYDLACPSCIHHQQKPPSTKAAVSEIIISISRHQRTPSAKAMESHRSLATHISASPIIKTAPRDIRLVTFCSRASRL